LNQNSQNNWFEQHPRKAKWLVFLICFLLIEITCRILVSAGLLHHETYPTTESPVFWAYIDPVVGMWRYPNTTFHHLTDCVDQVYETNSVGAMDPERSLESDAAKRVVVLGDSMIEGHGIARANRLSDLLESRTGIEHLNFAPSGSFGTIQEWLYYQEYAGKYDHSYIFVFILPANDFDDNDINEWSQKIYRPYIRKIDNNYEVYYPVEFKDRDMSTRSTIKIIKHTIDDKVYVLNALRIGTHLFKEKVTGGEPLIPIPKAPSYRDFSDEDISMMKYALGQISDLAGERTVYLFTIPVERDAEAAMQDGYSFRLVDEITAYAAKKNNVEYLDLLPYFLEYTKNNDIEYRDLTIGCNKHWGDLGNEVAAQAVYDFVYAK